MNVVGQDVLVRVGKRNAPLRAWLSVWLTTAEGAEWSDLSDVRASYASADGVMLASGTVVTGFNVEGNAYRLLSWIDYGIRLVEVLEVVTHAEYDKELWKARY